MTKKTKITSQEFLCALCFALCFFAFMLTEAFINERSAIILGSDMVNSVYTLGLVCTGVGFFSFSLLRRVCKTEKTRKRLLIVVGVLCLLAAVTLLLAEQKTVFLISAVSILLLTGHIGGCVYYNTAMYFADSQYMGTLIGSGMGLAIILQCVVQNLMPQSIPLIISIFLSVAFIMYFIIRSSKDWILENPLPYSSNEKTGRQTAIALVIAVVLMSLVSGMIDSVLTAFNAEKAYNIYSGVRLFYALGLFLAGFIADIKKRIYLPLATVCAILLSSVCLFFISEANGYFAGTALMYLYSGFYVIFFTVMFLDYAPKSRWPEFWAGAGRIVRSLTVAVAVLPTLKIYDLVGSTFLALSSCLLSIAILLVLLPHIGRAVSVSDKTKEAIDSSLSPQERLKSYARYCALTPRETEVLERLMTTEDDLQEIADNLYISRRMVQRYVSSIYEKTDTKTRLGLFQNYMNFTKK